VFCSRLSPDSHTDSGVLKEATPVVPLVVLIVEPDAAVVC
jgi:hypothetical protein